MRLTTGIIFSFVWCYGLMPAAHELLPGTEQERVEDEIKMDFDFYCQQEEAAAEEKFRASDSMMRQMCGDVRRGMARVNSAVDPQKMSPEERQYALLMREWAFSELGNLPETNKIGVLYDAKVFDPVSEFLRPAIRSKEIPLEALPRGIAKCGNKVLIFFENDSRMGIYDTWSEKLIYSQPFAVNIKGIITEEKNARYAVLVLVDDSVLVYGVKTGEVVSLLMIDEADKKAGLMSCHLSPNAASVVCCFKNKIVVYDRESGQKKYHLGDMIANEISFSLDGTCGAALSLIAPHYFFWNMETGAAVVFDDSIFVARLFDKKYKAFISKYGLMNNVMLRGDGFNFERIQLLHDRVGHYNCSMLKEKNGNQIFILREFDLRQRKPRRMGIKQAGLNCLYMVQNDQERSVVEQRVMFNR